MCASAWEMGWPARWWDLCWKDLSISLCCWRNRRVWCVDWSLQPDGDFHFSHSTPVEVCGIVGLSHSLCNECFAAVSALKASGIDFWLGVWVIYEKGCGFYYNISICYSSGNFSVQWTGACILCTVSCFCLKMYASYTPLLNSFSNRFKYYGCKGKICKDSLDNILIPHCICIMTEIGSGASKLSSPSLSCFKGDNV